MFIPNRRWSNLKDASNIPSNRWRIGLETGLIDGIIFTWKRGYSGDSLLINLVSRRGRLTVYSRVNWKNSVHGLWRLNREIKIHVYGILQTANVSWEFLRIENKQVKTVQNDSCGQNWHKTTYFCVEAINSKRKIRGKLGHVVQIHVCRLA